jgi:hypothetical protein
MTSPRNVSSLSLLLLVAAIAGGCAEASSPRSPEAAAPEVFSGPPASFVIIGGGPDGDPPPPPIDTMSSSEGGGQTTSFRIAHRARFTSDIEGTMGWIGWGESKQPEGTRVDGESVVYYRKGELFGKGLVRMSTVRGSLYIDFAEHLDRENGIIHTNCKSEKGGACATLRFRGAVFYPVNGRPERVSGLLLIGVPTK